MIYLPPELICLIASFLNVIDKRRLAATCRYIRLYANDDIPKPGEHVLQTTIKNILIEDINNVLSERSFKIFVSVSNPQYNHPLRLYNMQYEGTNSNGVCIYKSNDIMLRYVVDIGITYHHPTSKYITQSNLYDLYFKNRTKHNSICKQLSDMFYHRSNTPSDVRITYTITKFTDVDTTEFDSASSAIKLK